MIVVGRRSFYIFSPTYSHVLQTLPLGRLTPLQRFFVRVLEKTRCRAVLYASFRLHACCLPTVIAVAIPIAHRLKKTGDIRPEVEVKENCLRRVCSIDLAQLVEDISDAVPWLSVRVLIDDARVGVRRRQPRVEIICQTAEDLISTYDQCVRHLRKSRKRQKQQRHTFSTTKLDQSATTAANPVKDTCLKIILSDGILLEALFVRSSEA